MRFERDETYRFSPLVDEQGRHYGEKDDGYIDFGSVSSHFLDRQTQYGSEYIQGSPQGRPNLGIGLRFNGDLVDNYHSIGIHPDDIDEFVRRYNAYLGYTWGYVENEEGERQQLSEGNRKILYAYLIEAGVNLEPFRGREF